MNQADELHEKYKTSESFKKQMMKTDENYYLLCQQAHYSDLSSINKLFMIKFETHKPQNQDIYFIYGILQPTGAKALEKLTLYFIQQIPKPSRSYTLVYFNDVESPNAFSNFKNILNIMPIEYFFKLKQIYLVKSTLRSKAMKLLSFGTISKFTNAKIENVETLEELSEKIQVTRKDILHMLPFEVRESFADEITIETEEREMKTLVTSTPVIKQSFRPKEKFEIDEYVRKALNQQKNERGIPQLFELLIFYFKENPKGLQAEGIFRKSVSIDEQTQIMGEMAKKHYGCLQQIQNPHIIANLIKRFLANLKTPIVPYMQFQCLMNSPLINSELVARNVKELQAENMTKLLTLMLLIEFLKKDVIPVSDKNKMTVQNISICMAPCLMWAPEASIKDLIYASKSVQVVAVMIQNFQQVFGSRKDRKQLYRSSYIQQRKLSFAVENLEGDLGEEQIMGEKHEEMNERKSPNIAELMLEKTESFLDVLHEESEENRTETDKSPIFQQDEDEIEVPPIRVTKSHMGLFSSKKEKEEDEPSAKQQSKQEGPSSNPKAIPQASSKLRLSKSMRSSSKSINSVHSD